MHTSVLSVLLTMIVMVTGHDPTEKQLQEAVAMATVAVSRPSLAPARVCSQGWSKHGSRCFRVFTNSVNYAGAKAACRSKGGSLAMPKDKPTNDLLVGLRNGISRSASVWIGLNDIQQEGRFVWEDGQVLGSFHDWASSEPNNQPDGNADCVFIEKATSLVFAIKWRDYACNGRFGFICEKGGADCYLLLRACVCACARVSPGPGRSGSQRGLAAVHRSNAMTVELSKCASILEKAAKSLMTGVDHYSLDALSRVSSPHIVGVCHGTRVTACPTTASPEFRSADGRCNNRGHPRWGSTEQCLKRLLPPQYDDGFMTPRTTGQNRTPLPKARQVSLVMHEDLRKSSPVSTHMVMQFGQFLDHDITLTPNFQEEGLDCTCDSLDEHCFNIPVPSDDPDFSGRRCLGFARSRSCPNEGCRMGRRQQLNQITAFVDASNVYGSSDEEMAALRGSSGSVACPSGYQMYNGICYKAFNARKNFLDASSTCAADGGTLAMPKGARANAFLVNLKNAVDRSGSFWIGLVDQHQEGGWEWIDGRTLASYNAWGPGEPNNSGNEDCAEFFPDSHPSRKNTWNDGQCFRADRKFICQKIPAGCPDGYDFHLPTGRCYKAFNVRKTYNAAAATCAADGGTLAMPRGPISNKFLIYLKNAVDNNAVFRFGLTDRRQEGGWMWDDNVALGSFRKWGPGEPNNAGNEDCAEYFAGSHSSLSHKNTWNDGPCTSADRKFICQVKSSARGLLKSRPNPADANKKEFLPAAMTEDFECDESTGSETCSQAGDFRVNEQPGLTSMHTVFLREHNRIARRLSGLNPRWDDDRVFFETRKIVGALMQKITYGEDLPHVLGPAAMAKFHLTLAQSGFFSGYDSSVNPTISNVFATAAYRFGHSLVQGLFRRHDPDFNPGSTCPFELAFSFFNPSHIFNNDQGGPDSILRGLTAQPHQDFDRFMVSGLTKRLFADPPGSPGLDLAALNIQRGRDHGLPGYNAWRVKCGLPKANSFDDLAREIPDVIARGKLENLYSHVDDIDVFVGGLVEETVPGGVVGPTFACLIGLQFQDLRKGDRFWFENRGQFSAAQLAEIRKTSLARILCDNTDGTTRMQPDVFLQPTQPGNERVACSSLPQMDLTKWQKYT
ncbi:PXDN [Branchiostoma lanceolatum]|uniref:PXDN protein n=1 Tax=Branchiostoma lanceolatum TaxID=7740 RepID=A0A8K0F1R3_BRALA|nr:PXDN [Branchiostoma lanceolatum]